MIVLTKEFIRRMDEEQFRTMVLIPLLKEMGYFDVEDWHGRSELGKDVVGWNMHPVTHIRRNLAIVAKAKRPSKVAGIQEIVAQVTQAFNKSFPAPASQQDSTINDVWIVINKPLPKETRDSIYSAIPREYQRDCLIYDLDQVWDWVNEYLPKSTLTPLDQSQQQIRELDTNFQVNFSVTDEAQTLELGEKYPGQSENEPLNGGMTFQFPETQEARAKQAELQRAFETGSEVIIPEEYIKEFRLPAEIEDLGKQVFGDRFGPFTTLRISSAEDHTPRLLGLNIASDDGDHVEFPYLDFRVVQRGTKEISLTNEHQPIPVLVRLVVRVENESIGITVSGRGGSVSAVWLLKVLTAIECLYKPGRFSLTSLDSYLTLPESTFSGNQSDSPVDPRFKELVRDLALLQERVGLPIYVPEREFTDEEMEDITLLRKLLRSGIVRNRLTTLSLTAVWTKEIANSMLEEFKDGQRMTLHATEHEHCQLFGTEINLGEVQRSVAAVTLANEFELRSLFESLPDDEELEVKVQLTPGDDATMVSTYKDWLTDDDRADRNDQGGMSV